MGLFAAWRCCLKVEAGGQQCRTTGRLVGEVGRECLVVANLVGQVLHVQLKVDVLGQLVAGQERRSGCRTVRIRRGLVPTLSRRRGFSRAVQLRGGAGGQRPDRCGVSVVAQGVGGRESEVFAGGA